MNQLKKLLDKIPLNFLFFMAIIMSLLPFIPEPHLWEKLKMLANGTLVKPIDIFDLFWHGIWGVLLIVKLLLDRMMPGDS